MVVKVFNKMVEVPNNAKVVKDVIFVDGEVKVGDTTLQVEYIERQYDRWYFQLKDMSAYLNEDGLYLVLPKGGLN